MESDIAKLLADKRVCVCVGAGGVGKTSISAAVALGMAARGKKVAVITIDPAKRLANALGLKQLGNEPQRIDLRKTELELKGELWALMLDPKRTFDSLIEALAPDKQTRDEILDNRIYQQLSTTVAGSQEFSAIEKLYELQQSDQFDLLVLDTPPSRNALDFLDAPDRLINFFAGRAVQLILRPSSFGARLFSGPAALAFSALKRITGVDLLQDLAVFFRTLGPMTDAFEDHATAVKQLLRKRLTAFIIVTTPEREPTEEAFFFHQRLIETSMSPTAFVVNQMHHDTASDEEIAAVKRSLKRSLDPALATRVTENYADYHILAQRDQATVAQLSERLDQEPLLSIPYFDDDVHDIDGLLRLDRFLFGSTSEHKRLLENVIS